MIAMAAKLAFVASSVTTRALRSVAAPRRAPRATMRRDDACGCLGRLGMLLIWATRNVR